MSDFNNDPLVQFDKDEPPCYLYILMRTDLGSMNPGKAVAQGCHAANQFVFENQWQPDRTPPKGFDQWQASTPQGFGVTICLGVTGKQLQERVAMAKELGFKAGVTHDPSYPLRDGEVLHLIPLDTCGYIFGPKNDPKMLFVVGDLALMP